MGVVQSGTLQGGVYGAFSAALFYGVGNYFQNAGWAFDDGTACTARMTSVGMTAKVVSGGIAGGVMSSLQGGKFGNGFISAGVTTAAGPTIESVGNASGQAVVAAIVGGTASELSGGRFANGAVTGAFARVFQDIANGARQGESGRWLTPAQGSTDPSAELDADHYAFALYLPGAELTLQAALHAADGAERQMLLRRSMRPPPTICSCSIAA